MRSLKKVAAVLLTAAMTLSASVMAFADTTVTFHFQNGKNWEEVGGYIFQGITWKTNVTDNSFLTCNKADGTVKKLWPGAKCTQEKEGWYTCTATFTDDAVTDGMIFKFNNFVGDANDRDTQESDDTAVVIASGIKTTANATKEETDGILINKKMIANDFGGAIPSDIYVEYDGAKAKYSATAPDSYKNAAAVGGNGGAASSGSGNANAGEAGSASGNNTSNGTSGTAGTAGSTSNGSSSSTSAPKTGDAVAVTVVMCGILAAVVFVTSKKRVND